MVKRKRSDPDLTVDQIAKRMQCSRVWVREVLVRAGLYVVKVRVGPEQFKPRSSRVNR